MSGTGKVLSNQNRQRTILEPEIKAEVRKSENVTATIFNSPGDDSRPLPSDSFVYVEGDNIGGKIAVGFLDTANDPVSGDGEKRLYSRDSGGAIQAIIYFREDGVLEVNGNTDFAVSFNQLQLILTQLATDINANLTAIATSLSSIPAPTPYVPVPIVIDLTPAKISTVTLPDP